MGLINKMKNRTYMEKRYNTNWYMTLMFMLSMVVSLSFSACSDDDKNSSEQDMINTYVTKFQEQISEMAALRDDSPYGLQQGMYPEESKDILNSAIKKLEQVIENLSKVSLSNYWQKQNGLSPISKKASALPTMWILTKITNFM